MRSTAVVQESESREVSQLLFGLSRHAASMDPVAVARTWPGVERRVLACLRRLERATPPSESEASGHGGYERLRNLAWEVGVSADLHAVHARALSTLAQLFHEHAVLPPAREVPEPRSRARREPFEPG